MSPEQYLKEGDRLKQTGNLDGAVASYQKALSIQPEDVIVLDKIAEIYFLQGKLTEAIALCHQGVRNKPYFARAYKTLGNALQAQNKIQEATRAYSVAVQIDPNFVEAQVNLASMFYKQGLIDTAMVMYRKAIALKPDLAPAYWNLSKLLEQQGRLHEAYALQQKAIELQPELKNIASKTPQDSPFPKWALDKADSSSTDGETGVELNSPLS